MSARLLVLAMSLVTHSVYATEPAAPANPESAAKPTRPYSQIPDSEKVRVIEPANPDKFTPKLAKREGVEGRVLVEVAVSPSGKVVTVDVLEVDPADPKYGFAEAAVRVASATKYRNPLAEVATVKYRILFHARR